MATADHDKQGQAAHRQYKSRIVVEFASVAGGKALANRGRYLLGRTDNVGDPKSKTNQQATADYISAILRDGRGACFVVDPPSTPLHPFTSHTITVTAYSDMWGEYEDELVCEVPGLEPRVIPIRYEATGCPIVFQTTATSAHTLVRFGSHPPNAKPVKRPLKLRNTSSAAIRISWQTFNVLDQDETLLDMFTYIGDPFPRQTSTASLSANHPNTNSFEVLPPPSSDGIAPPPVTGTPHEDVSTLEGSREDLDEGGDGALFRVTLTTHEGVASSEPFDVHPKQMVIPAHGQGMVYVSLLPSSSSSSSSSSSPASRETLTSYALGYFSLDEQPQPHVTRAAGYDVEPLRIDLVAEIEHARLSLESDEDEGLTFSYPASILLSGTEVQERVTRTHHFTLVNHTASTLEFKIGISSASSSSHFMLIAPLPDSCIRLKPQRSTSVSVALSFSLGDIRSAGSTEKNASFADELQIEFSTGVKQVFPLTASIALPSLTISEKQTVFGTCLLGKPYTSSVVLSNKTPSDALWQAEISPDLNEVVSLSPSRGALPAHLSSGKCSTELLQITFCPKHECDYEGMTQLEEVLTGAVQVFTICGSGSPDEQFSHT